MPLLGNQITPDEAVQQAVGEIVEIVQALAQVIGLAQHTGAVVGLTRSTAASAVRPEVTASRIRLGQPWSWANMRKVSRTSRCSP